MDLRQKIWKSITCNSIFTSFLPADQYIMMRRSGCPMKESDLYPMLNLNPKVSNYPLPRRFQVTQPTVDDKMGDIKRKAYQDQGYSYGPEPTILNTERVGTIKKLLNLEKDLI